MNPYKILGIKETATDAEIKKAWRDLSKEYHPDIYKLDDEKFHQIQQAFELLNNSDLKLGYRLFGSSVDQAEIKLLIEVFQRDFMGMLSDAIRIDKDPFKLLDKGYNEKILESGKKISAANQFIQDCQLALNKLVSEITDTIIKKAINNGIVQAELEIEDQEKRIAFHEKLIYINGMYSFRKEISEKNMLGNEPMQNMFNGVWHSSVTAEMPFY